MSDVTVRVGRLYTRAKPLVLSDGRRVAQCKSSSPAPWDDIYVEEAPGVWRASLPWNHPEYLEAAREAYAAAGVTCPMGGRCRRPWGHPHRAHS